MANKAHLRFLPIKQNIEPIDDNDFNKPYKGKKLLSSWISVSVNIHDYQYDDDQNYSDFRAYLCYNNIMNKSNTIAQNNSKLSVKDDFNMENDYPSIVEAFDESFDNENNDIINFAIRLAKTPPQIFTFDAFLTTHQYYETDGTYTCRLLKGPSTVYWCAAVTILGPLFAEPTFLIQHLHFTRVHPYNPQPNQTVPYDNIDTLCNHCSNLLYVFYERIDPDGEIPEHSEVLDFWKDVLRFIFTSQTIPRQDELSQSELPENKNSRLKSLLQEPDYQNRFRHIITRLAHTPPTIFGSRLFQFETKSPDNSRIIANNETTLWLSATQFLGNQWERKKISQKNEIDMATAMEKISVKPNAFTKLRTVMLAVASTLNNNMLSLSMPQTQEELQKHDKSKPLPEVPVLHRYIHDKVSTVYNAIREKKVTEAKKNNMTCLIPQWTVFQRHWKHYRQIASNFRYMYPHLTLLQVDDIMIRTFSKIQKETTLQSLMQRIEEKFITDNTTQEGDDTMTTTNIKKRKITTTIKCTGKKTKKTITIDNRSPPKKIGKKEDQTYNKPGSEWRDKKQNTWKAIQKLILHLNKAFVQKPQNHPNKNLRDVHVRHMIVALQFIDISEFGSGKIHMKRVTPSKTQASLGTWLDSKSVLTLCNDLFLLHKLVTTKLPECPTIIKQRQMIQNKIQDKNIFNDKEKNILLTLFKSINHYYPIKTRTPTSKK